MTSGITWGISHITLVSAILLCLLCFTPTIVDGQIFNGGDVVATPTGTGIITSDVLPTYVSAQPKPSGNAAGGSNSRTAISNTTIALSPPAPTVPSLPIPVQPYTTMAPGGFPVGVATPLSLPTTPALFPQNISTCSTCYGAFSILSRCNVVANTDTFPITPNTTYQSLLPFLKCICTFKALDSYPYCIDCFTKTQQLNQLNVLQVNHLENYMDAFRQLCGATFNGNKAPDSHAISRIKTQTRIKIGLIGVASVMLTSILSNI